MISNERPSPYGQRNNYNSRPAARARRYDDAPRPHSDEETLRAERVQIERKVFVLTLKENTRGRFLRITEDMHGRRESIIVPASGLGEFSRLIEEMAKNSSAPDEHAVQVSETSPAIAPLPEVVVRETPPA